MTHTAKIYRIWDDENKNTTVKIIGSKSQSLKDLLYNSKRAYGFKTIKYEVLKTWQVDKKDEINEVLKRYQEKYKEDKLLTEDDVERINDLPSQLIKLIDENSKETTGKIYKSQLRKYCMFMNGGQMKFKYCYLHNLKKMEEYKDTLSISVQSQFTCAMLNAKRLLQEVEMKELETMNREVGNKQKTRKLEELANPKELKITVEKIREIAGGMNGTNINALVASLYAYEPPKRCDTWTRTKIGNNVKDDTQNNYINLDTGILHLNAYKTYSTYGYKEIKLDDRLIDKIKAFHKVHNNVDLLPNVTANNLSSKILKRVFNVGCNDLRHSYITDCMTKHGVNSKEFNDLCYKMNTSTNTAVLTYDDKKQIIKG